MTVALLSVDVWVKPQYVVCVSRCATNMHRKATRDVYIVSIYGDVFFSGRLNKLLMVHPGGLSNVLKLSSAVSLLNAAWFMICIGCWLWLFK